MSRLELTVLGPNQTEVISQGIKTLFSYNTAVACFRGSKVYRTSYKHSATTSKHINAWFKLYLIDSKDVRLVPQEVLEAISAGFEYNNL